MPSSPGDRAPKRNSVARFCVFGAMLFFASYLRIEASTTAIIFYPLLLATVVCAFTLGYLNALESPHG